MTKLIGEFQDGFNGDKVKCYLEPVEIAKESVKLNCVDSKYLIKWVSISLYKEALSYAKSAGNNA